MSWKSIITSNLSGYATGLSEADCVELFDKFPLDEYDLGYFKDVVLKAKEGGQADYDSFPDNGGIDIAFVLLQEVNRLRGG